MDSTPRIGSIASALARQRLEHRLSRIDRAIRSLVERRDALREAGSTPPAGLLAALEGFYGERVDLLGQLARLDAPADPSLEALGTT